MVAMDWNNKKLIFINIKENKNSNILFGFNPVTETSSVTSRLKSSVVFLTSNL